jgi:hypothetical protein
LGIALGPALGEALGAELGGAVGGLVGGLVGGDVGRLVLGENVHEEEFESYFLKALRSSDMAASADIEAVHIAFT